MGTSIVFLALLPSLLHSLPLLLATRNNIERLLGSNIGQLLGFCCHLLLLLLQSVLLMFIICYLIFVGTVYFVFKQKYLACYLKHIRLLLLVKFLLLGTANAFKILVLHYPLYQVALPNQPVWQLPDIAYQIAHIWQQSSCNLVTLYQQQQQQSAGSNSVATIKKYFDIQNSDAPLSPGGARP